MRSGSKSRAGGMRRTTSRAAVVLLGRRAGGGEIEATLRDVREHGGQADYVSADLRDFEALDRALRRVRARKLGVARSVRALRRREGK